MGRPVAKVKATRTTMKAKKKGKGEDDKEEKGVGEDSKGVGEDSKGVGKGDKKDKVLLKVKEEAQEAM